jgi:hypothetical protein
MIWPLIASGLLALASVLLIMLAGWIAGHARTEPAFAASLVFTCLLVALVLALEAMP